VSMCVRERERKRETVSVCVYVYVCVYLYVYVHGVTGSRNDAAPVYVWVGLCIEYV